jgi:hypothetical protein
LAGNVLKNAPSIVIIWDAIVQLETVFSVRKDGSDRNVRARDNVETVAVTIQGSVTSARPTCSENAVTKGVPKIAMVIPAADKLVTVCPVNLAGQATLVSVSVIVALMYANPIIHVKHVSEGGLVVIVDLPVRRSVMRKGVSGILDYVLHARMVFMEIDACVLVTVRQMGVITKAVVLPVLMGIQESSV